MANPTASPQVASTVGLKNVVIAPLITDTEETLTYGELQLMAGAIEASITPESADPDVQYADDNEFDVLYPAPQLAFKTKMADIPLLIQEMIFGNKVDDNGVLITSPRLMWTASIPFNRSWKQRSPAPMPVDMMTQT